VTSTGRCWQRGHPNQGIKSGKNKKRKKEQKTKAKTKYIYTRTQPQKHFIYTF
jgi:hypothetical protein